MHRRLRICAGSVAPPGLVPTRVCCGVTRAASGMAGSAALAGAGIERLADRGFLMLEGPETHTFLQGLLTNDTNALKSDDVVCQYSSMLHSKGLPSYPNFPNCGMLLIPIGCAQAACFMTYWLGRSSHCRAAKTV